MIRAEQKRRMFHFLTLQLAKVLSESHRVPCDQSSAICGHFLKAFRKCPENLSMDLDTWRQLLWSQALGDEYGNLAGEIYHKWMHLRYHYLALTPEIKSLLATLRQSYLVGLISNGPSCSQWEKIRKLGLRGSFDVILVSGDLPWEKPHRLIFKEACDYLGVQPKQCLMVGDKLETDIMGGIRAELGGTVWVPLCAEDVAKSDLHPDHILEHVTDLPQILAASNPTRPDFRKRLFGMGLCAEDFDDCNSNGSDGS